MISKSVCLAVMMCCLFQGCAEQDPTSEGQTSSAITFAITIDPNDVRQTIDGFGAAQPGGQHYCTTGAPDYRPLNLGNTACVHDSDCGAGNVCFYGQDFATALTQDWISKRDMIMDLAFSQLKGIGLTILRMKVSPTYKASASSGWNYADPAQEWVMQQAAARGPVKIIASAWSPPAWMKTNNSTLGGYCYPNSQTQACVLNTDCPGSGNVCRSASLYPYFYPHFADYLSHFAKEYAAAHGVKIYAVSLSNEPDTNGVNWDTAMWTSDRIRDFLAYYLVPTFASNQVTTKVITPEAADWDRVELLDQLSPPFNPGSPAFMKSVYDNPTARARVDIVAGHAYAGDTAKPFTTALSYGKPIWQTEFQRSGFDQTCNTSNMWCIQGALDQAVKIHRALTTSLPENTFPQGVSAWIWFSLFYGVVYDDSTLIGHGDTNQGDWTIYPSKLFYVLGNYSKFVRPGFARIGTGSTSQGSVYVTAYKDPTSGMIVVVAMNTSTSSAPVTFGGTIPTAVTPYVTSDTLNIAPQMKQTLASINSVPAQSIVTYVPDTSDIMWRKTDGTLKSWLVHGASYMESQYTSCPQAPCPLSDWQIQGTGDFNHDGMSDLLWRNSNTNSVVIWKFSADGQTFSQTTVTACPNQVCPAQDWQIVAVGDFDGDGTSDILWRNTDKTLRIWRMLNGLIDYQLTISKCSSSLCPGFDWTVKGVGDFNNDGKSDILCRRTDGATETWLISASPVPGATVVIGDVPLTENGTPLDTSWVIQGVGDFDNDGRSDIVWRRNTNALKIWFNVLTLAQGNDNHDVAVPTWQGSSLVPGADWQIAGVGDLNGDGVSDILWRDTDNGYGTPVEVWYMQARSPSASTIPIANLPLLCQPTATTPCPHNDWAIQRVGKFN